MRAIRCSKADLYAACAPSAVVQPWAIGGERDAADLGSAAHKIITSGIGGTHLELVDVAHEHQVDVDELQNLMRWGWKVWDRVKKHFVPARCEVPLNYTWPGGFYLTGHIDVLHIDEATAEARIADFKTGRLDGDHEHQLKAYAWLLFANCEPIQKIRVCTLHWRQQTADWETYSREDLGKWWAWFTNHLADTTTFRPGAMCRYCPRGATCPAKTALLKQAGEALAEVFTADFPSDQLERGTLLAKLLERVKLVEGFAAEVRSMIKADVAAYDGRLPMADGRSLVIKDEKRRQIDIPTGWPVLQAELGQDGLIELLKVSKTDVETAIKEKTGRGHKKHAVERVLDLLDKAGALTVQHVQKLEVVKGAINVESISGESTAAVGLGNAPVPAPAPAIYHPDAESEAF